MHLCFGHLCLQSTLGLWLGHRRKCFCASPEVLFMDNWSHKYGWHTLLAWAGREVKIKENCLIGCLWGRAPLTSAAWQGECGIPHYLPTASVYLVRNSCLQSWRPWQGTGSERAAWSRISIAQIRSTGTGSQFTAWLSKPGAPGSAPDSSPVNCRGRWLPRAHLYSSRKEP